MSLCGGGDVGQRLFGGVQQLFTFASAFLAQTRLRQTIRRSSGSCELTISAPPCQAPVHRAAVAICHLGLRASTAVFGGLRCVVPRSSPVRPAAGLRGCGASPKPASWGRRYCRRILQWLLDNWIALGGTQYTIDDLHFAAFCVAVMSERGQCTLLSFQIGGGDIVENQRALIQMAVGQVAFNPRLSAAQHQQKRVGDR